MLDQPAAWGGKRAAWGTMPAAGGGSNLIDRHTWTYAYEGQDAVSRDWPPVDSGITWGTYTNPTLNRSTTGITVPSRMTDKALRANGYYDDFLFDWTHNKFHWRAISKPSGANGMRYFRYLVTSSRLAEVRFTGSSTVIFTVQNSLANSTTVTLPTSSSGWYLIDWVVDGANMNVFINGSDYSPSTFPGARNFSNGPDAMLLLGFNTLAGDHLFFGWRMNEVFTLAEHQTDSTELFA